MTYKVEILSDLCSFADGRVAVADLDTDSYISTENMLPNKEGITRSAGLPTVLQTQAYQVGDVLISNIRPYFRKIWYADREGGCSNDVLVLRAKGNCNSGFLYYLLSDDNFFDYATATAKGTKMPRGDKTAIMRYGVRDLPLDVQIGIAVTLSSLDAKIANNTKINHHLEQIAQAIFKSWFVDFEPFIDCLTVASELDNIPHNWKIYHLVDFLPVITGKKNANVSSSTGAYPFFSCSQGFSWTHDYSFEGNAILVAGNGDFNIKFYNGKFEAYQRTYVLIPYEPRYTSWLYYAIKHNLNSITSAARGSVIKFITKGTLEDFAFAAPAKLAETEIIDIFALINRKISMNNEENSRLGTLRDSLLPRLMSGKLSVTDLNPAK